MQLCPQFTSFNQILWGFVFLDYSCSCLSSKKCFQLCKHDQNSELSKNWMMPCYDLFSNGSDVNELWKQKHSNLESRFKLAILGLFLFLFIFKEMLLTLQTWSEFRIIKELNDALLWFVFQWFWRQWIMKAKAQQSRISV